MAELNIGDQAPAFTLPSDGGGEISLSDFKGKPVVLYFYPKDDTPGCTMESCNFRDNMKSLQKIGVQVIGISKDSVKSHDKFKAKYELNFPLGSDEDTKTCQAYGVWGEKSMMGRKFMGVNRTTFLIDQDGKIARIWRNVKVPGHVDEVKTAATELSKKAA